MTSKGKATIFSLHSKRNLDEGNSESNFFQLQLGLFL